MGRGSQETAGSGKNYRYAETWQSKALQELLKNLPQESWTGVGAGTVMEIQEIQGVLIKDGKGIAIDFSL